MDGDASIGYARDGERGERSGNEKDGRDRTANSGGALPDHDRPPRRVPFCGLRS